MLWALYRYELSSPHGNVWVLIQKAGQIAARALSLVQPPHEYALNTKTLHVCYHIGACLVNLCAADGVVVLLLLLLQGSGLASLNLPHLMDALRSLSLALQALGSPAREGPARLAHTALQDELAAAVAANDTSAFARVATRALALLRVQARMLRLDLANVRLHVLASTLKNGSGTR